MAVHQGETSRAVMSALLLLWLRQEKKIGYVLLENLYKKFNSPLIMCVCPLIHTSGLTARHLRLTCISSQLNPAYRVKVRFSFRIINPLSLSGYLHPKIMCVSFVTVWIISKTVIQQCRCYDVSFPLLDPFDETHQMLKWNHDILVPQICRILCGRETWSHTPMEGQKQRVCENEMMWRIF